MSDFDKLRNSQDFAGSLLRSALHDAPQARARRRVALVVGLGSNGAVGALGAGASATSSVALGASHTGAVSVTLVAKWFVSSFGVAVVASSALVVGSELVPGASEPAPLASALAPVTSAAPVANAPRAGLASRGGAAVGLLPSVQSSNTVVEAGEVRASGPAGVQRAQSSSAPPPRARSVADEIAWLDPAQRALRANDGVRALAYLRQAGPHIRLLRSEAQLLQVEALLLTGRRQEAENTAQALLNRDPAGAHALRVRRLLGNE